MNKNKVIGIMACDLRQVYMAQFIMNKGYLVNLICSENLAQDKKFKDIINRLIGSNTHNKLHVICDIDEFIRLSQVIVTPIPFNKISEFINKSGRYRYRHGISISLRKRDVKIKWYQPDKECIQINYNVNTWEES